MTRFLLWCLLFVLCWPVAILAVLLYPLVWVVLLPFRLAGLAVGAVFLLLWTMLTLPVRVLSRVF